MFRAPLGIRNAFTLTNNFSTQFFFASLIFGRVNIIIYRIYQFVHCLINNLRKSSKIFPKYFWWMGEGLIFALLSESFVNYRANNSRRLIICWKSMLTVYFSVNGHYIDNYQRIAWLLKFYRMNYILQIISDCWELTSIAFLINGYCIRSHCSRESLLWILEFLNAFYYNFLIICIKKKKETFNYLITATFYNRKILKLI